MDVLTSFLLLCIATLPIGEVIRYQFGNGIAVTLTDVVVCLTGLFYLLFNKQKNVYKIVLPFLLSIILSLLFNMRSLSSSQFLVASLYPIRWFLYLQLFFIAKNIKKKDLLTKLLLITGFITVLFGYVQYFLYPNLRNLYYLGWDDHLYRMFSTVLDPNFAGALFVLFFVLSLSQFLGIKGKMRYIYALNCLITLSAVFLTFSRSAMIMLICVSIAFLFLLRQAKLLILLFASIILFYVVASSHFYLENINPFRIVSTEARFQTAQIALTIFKNNPIFGVGFNAYRYAQIRYGYRNGPVATVSHADASTDNSFLFILATTGIIGFFSFAYFWKEIVYKLKNSKKDRLLRFCVMASILGIFINALFINSLFFPFIMVWMWVLLGLAV